MTSTTTYRLALAVAVGTVLFLLLGIGALGVIGSGGPADRVYLAVPVVLVLGSILSRLRAEGMAVTLLATAATQVLAPVVAFAAGLEGTEGASVLDVVGLTGMFAGLFLLSAWLFRRSARRRTRTAVA
jgi:hypothetical protein